MMRSLLLPQALALVLVVVSLVPAHSFAQAPTLDPDSQEAKSLETRKHNILRSIAASSPMVYIEGGTYEGETIEPFYMDAHLVTLEQYRACVSAGVCPPPPENDYWSDTWKKQNTNLPINNVSWFNAQTFADWVGKRLPTEQEWEWAAQGRDEGRIYPWGNEAPGPTTACWKRYNGQDDTGDGPCEVGLHRQSRDGVYDLSGNLWEWTATFTDSTNMLVVLKGGAWYNDNAEKLKVKARGVATPYHRGASSDGIRLVVSKKDRDKVFSHPDTH